MKKTLVRFNCAFFLTDVHPSASVLGSCAVPTVRHTDEEEPQALTFHGIILRSQLVTLLKRRVFYSENARVNPVTRIDVIHCIYRLLSSFHIHKCLYDFVWTEMVRGKVGDSIVCQTSAVSFSLSVILR